MTSSAFAAPGAVIRDFDWTDHPGIRGLWETGGNDVVPEPELRSALAANPGLMLVVEDTGIVGVRSAPSTATVAGSSGSPSTPTAAARVSRIDIHVLPGNADGLAFWQHRGYLAQPDVLCSTPV